MNTIQGFSDQQNEFTNIFGVGSELIKELDPQGDTLVQDMSMQEDLEWRIVRYLCDFFPAIADGNVPWDEDIRADCQAYALNHFRQNSDAWQNFVSADKSTQDNMFKNVMEEYKRHLIADIFDKRFWERKQQETAAREEREKQWEAEREERRQKGWSNLYKGNRAADLAVAIRLYFKSHGVDMDTVTIKQASLSVLPALVKYGDEHKWYLYDIDLRAERHGGQAIGLMYAAVKPDYPVLSFRPKDTSRHSSRQSYSGEASEYNRVKQLVANYVILSLEQRLK